MAVAPLLDEEMVFRVVDVGEHRNERKKWVGQHEIDEIVVRVVCGQHLPVLFESLAVWLDIVAELDAEQLPAELQLGVVSALLPRVRRRDR